MLCSSLGRKREAEKPAVEKGVGMTPRFVALSQKHMEDLKNRQLVSVA